VLLSPAQIGSLSTDDLDAFTTTQLAVLTPV